MTERHDILANIRTWTLDGLTVDGEDDQRRFQQFYNENPEFKEVILERIRQRDADPRNAVDPEVAERTRLMKERIDARGVPSPMRSSEAIETFVIRKDSNATITQRTIDDKKRLLTSFFAHLATAYPDLGVDPYIHAVQPRHIDSFLASMRVRRHRGDAGQPGMQRRVAPGTVEKKIYDLRTFFIYAHITLQVTTQDPTQSFAPLAKDMRTLKHRQKSSYRCFTDEHLEKMFQPKTYLAFNRSADYFWAPLIGLHTGLRLGEIVTLTLAAIQEDPHSRIWTIEVVDEAAKNDNSMRRVPIPRRLIKLGFLRYVRHVRALGASVLFPHRDMKTSTFKRDPSKRCSAQFGKYLDTLDISDDRLVFHSFRHNVVTALQDGNTPMHESMQLVGHAAQDHAVATAKSSKQQASSVHNEIYAHPDSPRMNVTDPIARLKGHLDRCVTPQLNYRRLRLAAAIVQDHTVKTEARYQSGWTKLGARTRDLLQELE